MIDSNMHQLSQVGYILGTETHLICFITRPISSLYAYCHIDHIYNVPGKSNHRDNTTQLSHIRRHSILFRISPRKTISPGGGVVDVVQVIKSFTLQHYTTSQIYREIDTTLNINQLWAHIFSSINQLSNI